MQKSQITKIALVLVLIGGAFLAQKMGWISQSTFNQFLGGQNTQNESTHNENTELEGSTTTSVQDDSSALLNDADQSRPVSFTLPQDRGDICASDLTLSGDQDEALYKFALDLGLSYPETFVRVSNHINQTGRLPDCYMRKNEARNLGWSGGPLWGYADGRAIGGNRFGNREGGLPRNYNGKYIEADLDYDGRRRGADRLVFVQNSKGQWLQWVTVNHYDSFHLIPQAN